MPSVVPGAARALVPPVPAGRRALHRDGWGRLDGSAPDMDSPQADEVNLLDRALAGDEGAFVSLVARYQAPLLRFARTFVRLPAHAEDVVLDTWLAVLTGLDRFERRASFKTWLFRILANRARTKAVRESRYEQFGDAGEEPVNTDNFTPAGRLKAPPREWSLSPERLLQSKQARAIVDATLNSLPAGQRAVVTLRDIDGLDAAEVCNILDITETNQRVLLHRGRTRIRAALAAGLE